ncbi:MAG: hypothetical protein GXY55_16105 [Phycisphaerae bacterium]|nr:hypothetical protein [Phycisphaerae bacterium]
MDDQTFQARLADARRQIDTLPVEKRAGLMALLEETRQRHDELKTNFARAREAMGEWRLLMKYLIFDHEATRRERDDLRRRLNES